MAGEINFVQLAERIADQYHGSIIYSAHGPAHWRRVEQNGLLLSTKTGADVLVVKLFALFHDSRRQNETSDDGHGARGAAYATELRGELFELDDSAFALLTEACIGHTDRDHSDDPTIGTCWDADRLDLGRVGIIPNPDLMSTAFGKEIARVGSIQPFLPKQI
jgi:uncharacterized protein